MWRQKKTYVTNRGWLMNWMGPGSIAQKVTRNGHFCPQDPGEQERWAEIQRGGVRGKGGLISCSIGLCFLCDGRGQVTVLERGVGGCLEGNGA